MAKRDVMIFGDPPAARPNGNNGFWTEHLQPLIERQPEWALVRICDSRSHASGAVGHLRTPGKTRLPEGRWEFVSRGMDDGHAGVWARYLGPPVEAGVRLVPPASVPPPTRARTSRPRKSA